MSIARDEITLELAEKFRLEHPALDTYDSPLTFAVEFAKHVNERLVSVTARASAAAAESLRDAKAKAAALRKHEKELSSSKYGNAWIDAIAAAENAETDVKRWELLVDLFSSEYRHIDGEWIAVTERLPELNALCMVYSAANGWQKAVYEGDQWTVQSPDAYQDESALTDVTHWGELPSAPPRKVGEK